MEQKNSYNHTFGILSCIGIVCMVMGHFGCELLEFDGWFPYYSFHMPLFIFISGYFYKDESKSDIKGYILKLIKKLLIPFYEVSFIYLIIQTILSKYGYSLGLTFNLYNWLVYPWVNQQTPGFYVATWFVIALIWVKVINIGIRKVCAIDGAERDFLLFLIYFIISICLICCFRKYEIKGFLLVILRSIFLLVFFQIGFIYKKYLEKYDGIKNIYYFGIVFLLQGLIRFKYGYLTYGVFNCSFPIVNVGSIYLTTFLGIAFWLRIAKIFTPLLKDSKLVVYIGKHTSAIMSHHLFAVFLIQTIVYYIQKYVDVFNGFDVEKYQSWVYYLYVPHEVFRLYYSFISMALVIVGQYINDYFVKYKRVKGRDKCTII